jgi:hypothetical protein
MTKQTKDIITIVSILIFAILAIIFVPLATIWSLNTLFPILSIPYTFYSWLAVIVMNLTWMYKPIFKKD